MYVSFPKAFWLVPDAKGRVVQGFCQWLEPSYAPTTNWARWNQEAVELASLSPEHAHPTLLFYVYGDCSRHLTSQLAALSAAADADDSTGSARQDARDKFLASFFSPYYSRLPHYDASSADCVPTSFLATSWLTDDLAGNGSYCNFPVGLERGDDDIRTMREGLPDRGLWLAGEHTAPFVGLGTATGAYWSGESVARRIAEAYGLARRR